MAARWRGYTTRAILAAPGPMSTLTRSLVVMEILAAYLRTAAKLGEGDVRRLIRGGEAGAPAIVADARRAAGAGGGADARRGLDAAQARRVALALGWAVTRTLTVLPTDSRCLAQSLVLSRLLSARGIDSRLVIGARTQPSFQAHAWVECAGLPVLPPQGFEQGRLIEL